MKKSPNGQFDSPHNDPWSIGNLALSREYITRADLDAALKVQQQMSKIGTILVDMGKMTQEQLDELLMDQAIHRGDITDLNKIRKFERSKYRRRMDSLRETFSEAGGHSQQFAAVMMAKANGD